MIDVYEYRQDARRPAIWASAILAGFLVGVMIWQSAPWYMWAVSMPAAVFILAYIARNPVTGIRLTENDLTLSPWRAPEIIALKDIRTVRIIDWQDSTDMEIHLRNGNAARIQDCDMPPRADFVRELERRQVVVEQS